MLLLSEGIIEEGSLVLIMIDRKRRFLIKVNKDKIIGTDKGYIKHSDIIGLPYGSCIYTSQGVKAYLLKPLHHDLLYGYKRITQVIYPKDSGYMVYLSGIGPGSRVVEAGIGTGYLTTYLAHIVGKQGKVYGYEIKESYIEIVKKNLKLSGLFERVVIRHADIRKGILEENIDAIFLDIPDPWNVVEHAYKALKPSHPIVIYVPTVNQVEKVVLKLRKHGGYIDIRAQEILLRNYIIEENATRPEPFMIGHTGYIVYARKVLRH